MERKGGQSERQPCVVGAQGVGGLSNVSAQVAGGLGNGLMRVGAQGGVTKSMLVSLMH